MIRAFKYPLYPTVVQEKRLDEILWRCRELYNAALEERKSAYERAKRFYGDALSSDEACRSYYGIKRSELLKRSGMESPSWVDQSRGLTEARAGRDDLDIVPRQVCTDVIRRLDKAFVAFFRRAKAGMGPRAGYPRFARRDEFNSFTFGNLIGYHGSAARLASDGRRIHLATIGDVKLRLHRPIEGKPKTTTVLRDSVGKWWVVFACDGVAAKPLPDTGVDVGIDLGLKTFAALSNGEMVANPRHLQASQLKLTEAQRSLSRKKRGGKNRKRAQLRVAKIHQHITNQRQDMHRQTAADLVKRFDRIAVEDLNIKGMVQSNLGRSISDAGWGGFVHALETKAEATGRIVEKVNPSGTSQDCSRCGVKVPKDLSVRVHDCPHCGLKLDRDTNAALNVLRLGLSRWGVAEVGGVDP